MAIGSFPPDERPKVHEHEGEIIIWSGDLDDPNGVLFSAEAGLDVGMECLAIAAKLTNRPTRLLQTQVSVEDNVRPDDDVAGRMVVTIEGAPFEIRLSATQICEFAATFTAMARRFD